MKARQKRHKTPKKTGAGKRSPNHIDAVVGLQIRRQRTLLGLSQEELAAKLGISFQQIQKYEGGSNRIGAGRLYQIAGVLKTDIVSLYGNLPPPGEAPSAQVRQSRAAIRADKKSPRDRDLLELVRAFHAIGKPVLRKNLVRIANSMAAESGRRPKTRVKAKKAASKVRTKTKSRAKAKPKSKAKAKSKARTKTRR